MKLLLKILLSFFILIVGIYAATPLWLPYVLASQLPPGWQLEKLETDYAGISGININQLRVKGGFQAVDLSLAATDIRFSYRGWKTEIDSILIDVFQPSNQDSSASLLSLDDLSLPVARLTGKLPELSIKQLQLALHSSTNLKPANTVAGQPLLLNFQAFKLIPRTNNNFDLSSSISAADLPGVNGQLEVNVGTNSRKAAIRFPAEVNSPAWLTATLEQTDRDQKTTTHVEASLDTEPTDKKWLDEILARGTSGFLTRVNGKLQIQADFTGDELQNIKSLSVSSEELQLDFEDGALGLNAEFLASREGENISISLSKPAELQFLDTSGKIEGLITAAETGLQRTSQPQVMAHAVLDASSRIEVHFGIDPSMRFNGGMNLNMASPESNVSLQATELQIEIEDFSKLDSAIVKSLVALKWEENVPIAFASDDLELKADKLSLASTGQLRMSDQTVEIKQTGDFETRLEGLQTRLQTGTPQKPVWQELTADHYVMRGRLDFDLSISEPETPVNFYYQGSLTATHPVIQIPGDEHSLPMTIEAIEMSISAESASSDGNLISTGNGTFISGHITPFAISAGQVDLDWQALDLLNLTGKLNTRTQGFSTEFDDEIWTGFDFDIGFTLLGNDDIDGSGMVKFESGPDLPIEFTGNIQAEHWDITLPPATIKPSQISSLLAVANFELPESVELTDGYIDMQGDVVIDDDISAKIALKGHELGASMLESSASNAAFTFQTSYGTSISASGPVTVETLTLAGGIDVAHIRADLKLENTQTFGLKNLYAEVFDGQINLDSLRFSDNRIEDTTVELSHLNLGHLLAFADIDGLEGTGFLDFLLPTGSDQIGIHVKDGTFSSNGPGRLAYTQEGVAGSNIGLQALENFQYTDLSGTINYQSDGAYNIAMRLEGKNPDLYGGHPIVFNLNIDGSLPEVFEAMFITGDFEESILNQVRTNEP